MSEETGGVVAGRSHPLGVRELKPLLSLSLRLRMGSHPLGVRELKHVVNNALSYRLWVAPFRGA